MGVYVYTRRNDVKTVDGVDIVRFGYAYKSHFWEKLSRTASRLESMGETAAYKTRHVQYAVFGEWKYAAEEMGLAIFEVTDRTSSIIDDAKREYIGFLKRQGHKWWIEWKVGPGESESDVDGQIARLALEVAIGKALINGIDA